MLIRVGANRGFNTDQLLHWTYTPKPEPAPAPEPEPEPEPMYSTEPAATEPASDDGQLPEPSPVPESDTATSPTAEEGEPEGHATLTLVFTTGQVTLEGDEADKLQAYLLTKTGAAV